MLSTDGGERILIFTIAAIVLLGSGVGSFYFFGEAGLAVHSSMTMGILTLALVMLYHQQSEVLEQQVEWMKLDHLPSLWIDPRVIVDGDRVTVTIQNVGRGGAAGFWLEAEIEENPCDVDLSPALSRLEGTEDNSLSLPSEEERSFEGKVVLARENGDAQTLPFSFVAKELVNAGHSSVTLHLRVHTDDEALHLSDQDPDQHLLTEEIELPEDPRESTNLEDLVDPSWGGEPTLLPLEMAEAFGLKTES